MVCDRERGRDLELRGKEDERWRELWRERKDKEREKEKVQRGTRRRGGGGWKRRGIHKGEEKERAADEGWQTVL